MKCYLEPSDILFYIVPFRLEVQYTKPTLVSQAESEALLSFHRKGQRKTKPLKANVGSKDVSSLPKLFKRAKVRKDLGLAFNVSGV